MGGENIPRLDRLKREFLLCMKNHIVARMRARDEICAAMKQEFEDNDTDFFNLSVPARHIRIVRLLMACLEKYKPHEHLQEAFAIWDLRLAPAVFALPDATERKKYGCLAKLLAACLFDSDEYTKAVSCLGHVVRLHDGDTHSRQLLLCWLCLLGQWSLAKIQLDREKNAKKESSLHSAIVAGVIRDAIHLHTLHSVDCYSGDASPEQQCAIEAVKYSDSVLRKSSTKTFQQYEAQILIKRTLTDASHFSSSNLSEIGDPLQNMEIIKARYETLVKCRSNAFYGDKKKEDTDCCTTLGGLFLPSDGESQDTKIDEYLKLNAAVAEHFRAVLQLVHRYVEMGILRESESEGIKLLHQSLKSANMQRSLSVLNVLLLASTLGRGNGPNVRPDAFRPIVAAFWDKSPEQRNSYSSDQETRKNVPMKSSVLNELKDRWGKEANNLLLTNKETKHLDDKFEIEEHNEDCSCIICALCDSRPQIRVEAVFSKFLLCRFSSKIFRLLSQRIQELPREISMDAIAICSALQIKETEEAVLQQRYPLQILDLFLVAAIRWLRRVGEIEKPEIIEEVIRESLKICSLDPVRFRWQWLTIRQLARSPLEMPKLDWMHGCASQPKTGLRSPLKSIVNNLASELNALTLCSPRPARNLNVSTGISLSKTSKVDRGVVPNFTIDGSISELEEAGKDFDCFSHLFYREWRFQTCSYLGQASVIRYKTGCLESDWSAAYYFNEAMSISTRQLARAIRRSSEDNQTFHFEHVEKFQEAVRSLPSDLTVVQLFLDSRRILWLIKLRHDRPPLVVPIALISQDNTLLKRFLTLLMENDASGNLSKTCTDPKKYWVIRRRLDTKLKALIDDVEAEWFGIFSVLLLPCTALNDASRAVVDEIKGSGFSRSVANALVENLNLRVCDWKRLLQRFAALTGLNEAVAMHLCDCRSRWMAKYKKGSFSRDLSSSYVLFCISPELASFPFELLPVMSSHKRVCRISSFHMFQKLLSRSKEIPKSVDGRNSFYVLDPGGDLTDTQERLAKELRKYTFWRGTIGAAPKPEELRTFLETSDLFFYMGHGSGGRYFGRSAVLRSDCRAVSLLMGCSSVRIIHEGEGFDGRGAIYDYVIAKCPCVVGCLWMVTDGEIDRVLLALLKYCFSHPEKQGSDKADASSSYRLLIDGLAHARDACKLKYMTGGAVVAYGLPIVTYLSQHMPGIEKESETELREEECESTTRSRKVQDK